MISQEQTAELDRLRRQARESAHQYIEHALDAGVSTAEILSVYDACLDVFPWYERELLRLYVTQ